jgi:hypothetical protein
MPYVFHLTSTVETGIHPWKAHFSNWPLKVTISHRSRLWGRTAVRSTPWGRRIRRWASLNWFLTILWRHSSVVQIHGFISCWLVSDDPAGEEAGCGGSGLAWLHVVCGCDHSLDILPNSLKQRWRKLMIDTLTLISAHFTVAFYCHQHKVCHDHAV